MDEAALPSDRDDATSLGPARATLLATFAVLAVNLTVIATQPLPRAGASVRLFHVLYETGHILAVGLAAMALVSLWTRFGRGRPARGYFVLAAVTFAMGIPTLGEDLTGFSQEAAPGAWRVLLYGLVFAFAAITAGTAWIGNRLARPLARWVGVAAGVAGLVANHLVLADDYPAAHLFLALVGGTGIAASVATAPIPSWWWRAKARLPLAIAIAVAGSSLWVRPSNTVMTELLGHSGSIVAPYLARTVPGGSAMHGKVLKKWKPWFSQREGVEAIPPSDPLWRPDTTVVLLITIDSLRADMIAGGKNDEKVPNLARLRDDSIVFTEARAPGSQTVYTLAQMFSSRYFSQTYWTRQQGIRDLWPHEDESVRFPELLRRADVKTMTAAGTVWLSNKQGIVRGFDIEEWEKPKKKKYQVSGWQIPRLINQLDQLGDGDRFFGYAHLLDAHYTVSPIKRKGARRRFVANLQLIDKQLGKLRAYLEDSQLGERSMVIVSSDHGEGFGQHGTKHHRNNLYEELVRVPLWVWSPGIEHKEVTTKVSLIDMGPTILDIFGESTPGSYMGQSLVPLLRGDKGAPNKLTRPIVAEGRLKRAFYFDDGFKAIVDERNYTMELYNLRTDPQEQHNMIENQNSPGLARIAVLKRFFESAQIKRKGYEIPYRP